MTALTLGLDLGPASIGWTLIDEANSRIVDMGVRVFPEGVDNFDTSKEKSRNEQRRIARSMRRQVRRRAARQRELTQALVTCGLFPADPTDQTTILKLDPYALRARALDDALTPHEIGRVLLHLSQRRGFLSNRKRDRDDKKLKGLLEKMQALEGVLKESGSRTLGEFLYAKSRSLNHAERVEDDHVRNRPLKRQWIEDEFHAIWDAQSHHHPAILTDTLRYGAFGRQRYPMRPRRRPADSTNLQAYGLHGILFFHRPTYWPKSVVGLCELEPKLRRCPRADRRAQRLRMLQEVNNLRYIDPDTTEEKPLNPDHRALLLDRLSHKDELTFDQIRKALGFADNVRFNLERGQRSKLQGMVSDALLAGKKAIGSQWYDFSDDRRNGIVALLAESTDDDLSAERLVAEFGLTAAEADGALGVELPTGYSNFSLVAIEKLLPHVERGLRLMGNDETDSAVHAAGYMRRDQLRRRIFDQLPDPARTRDCRLGDIPNPVVKRALVELRKVVNAIIREYGKPAAVHIEMARDMKPRPKPGTPGFRKYMERITAMREQEERRHNARKFLSEHDQPYGAAGSNILKVLLWEQQGRECIYCDRTISQTQLFSGDVDVDHILPYSRTLDDSQMNKVVCHRTCNADKGDQTPFEWLGGRDPSRFDRICQRGVSLVRKGMLPYKKYQRLIRKELNLDDFIARQLSDTGYITRATAEYVRCLFENDHDVLGLKGELTAELRRQWGLDTILESMPDSPAWTDGKSTLRPGEKNRADHRHHAIDALVVALTNRSRLQKLSRIKKSGGMLATGEALDFPWETFRDDAIARVREIKVSHRAERKVAAALHEDTFYGTTEVQGVFVVRKPLESLSPNEVPLIRDKGIREIVEARLREHGISVGRGKKVENKVWRQAVANLTMPSGVPIRKVRVLRKEQTIQPIRRGRADEVFVKPGSIHHLCIFEWEEKGKKKREAAFVTMLDAINRIKRAEEIIQRTPPVGHRSIPQHAQFIMSLSRGEFVLADWKGRDKLLVFKTAASTQGQIYFAEHTDARRSSDQTDFVAKANTLKGRKVTVDPIGRVRWAND